MIAAVSPRRLRPAPPRAWLAGLVSCAALFVLPHSARAVAPSRSQVLLTLCPSRASLRASLLFYADSIQSSQAAYAGEALTYAGQSYDRASLRDSAIACYRRAVATRGGDDERLALADDLLIRRGEGDVEDATQMLQTALDPGSGIAIAREAHEARLAWALLLADSTKRSYDHFRSIEPALDLDPVWGYRMARAFVEADDVKRALAALQPLAIASRAQDEEVMNLADRAFARFGDKNRLESGVHGAIEERDQSEAKMLQAMHARRVRFSAGDGFALGGVVASADQKLRRAAVVVVAPGDTMESYDSLTVALGHAGWAVIFMDTRGSSWSAAPSCPFHESWVGREDAMQSVCARDVRDALRALSLTAKIDTTRYLVAGIGLTAAIAVEAARLDARVPALLLLSPAPDPVERGTLRESIRKLHRPIYFSSAPEDFLQFETTDVLYQAGDRPNSRVGDVNAPGTGARPFRRNAAALKRLIAWLDDTMPAKAVAKAATKPQAKPKAN